MIHRGVLRLDSIPLWSVYSICAFHSMNCYNTPSIKNWKKSHIKISCTTKWLLY